MTTNTQQLGFIMNNLSQNQQKFLDYLLSKIKTYKKHSKIQSEILELSKKTQLTPTETKRLSSLLDIEKANAELEKRKKQLADLDRLEKQQEKKKYDHVTFTLGGLFRSELEKQNPVFIQALQSAIQNNKIKTTHKDNTPMFDDLLPQQSTTTLSQFNH